MLSIIFSEFHLMAFHKLFPPHNKRQQIEILQSLVLPMPEPTKMCIRDRHNPLPYSLEYNANGALSAGHGVSSDWSVPDCNRNPDRALSPSCLLSTSFYSVMKTQDRYIRFGFLTGVTKFGKVSVFSDLNNLCLLYTSTLDCKIFFSI